MTMSKVNNSHKEDKSVTLMIVTIQEYRSD